jgi:hypothetical protein
MGRAARFPLVAAAFILSSLAAFGQSGTGRISGVVRDPAGAVVPGVTVVALHEATGVSRETISNDSGLYVFEGLPVGPYTITAELTGFKKFVSQNNLLSVGDRVSLDVALAQGEISETVTVTETATKVQSGDASIGTVIDGQALSQLPLNGRNPLHLIAFQPGVTGRGANIFVSGQRARAVNTMQDGIEVNDPAIPRAELSMTMINPDALQEYRVVTASPKAEYGRNSGATVEIVTRSGSNRIHGNAFEFHRNTALNANDFFNNASGVPKEVLRRHQFGFSLGGPIKKNRTFVFGNYQGQRQAAASSISRTVLTREARAGLFRWDPANGNQTSDVDAQGNPRVAVQTFDIVANDPRRLGLDPTMKKMIDMTPLPNDFTGGDGLNRALFRFNANSKSPSNQMTVRVDHELTSKHHLWTRYSLARTDTIGDAINGGLPRYPGEQFLPGRTQGGRAQGASVGMNSTLTQRLVNEFTIGFTRRPVEFLDPTHPGLTDRNVTEYVSNSYTDPFIYWPGTGRTVPVYQLNDNVSFTRRNHTFKTGAYLRSTHFNQFRNVGIYPRVTFSRNDAPTSFPGLPTSINTTDRGVLDNLYNDVLGVVGRVTQTFYSDGKGFPGPLTSFVRGYRFKEYDFFFQDDWRISSRLTVNLGLRYELKQVPYEVNSVQVIPDHVINQYPVTYLRRGVETDRSWTDPERNNFAPIVGFSWDPFGNSKTAVRGSYRLAYNRVVSWAVNVIDQNTPGLAVNQIYIPPGSSLRLRDNVPAVTVPTKLDLRPPDIRQSALMIDPGLRTPYVNQWSLSLQRELARHTVVELDYVGSHGSKLFRMYNLNQIDIVNNGFLAGFNAVAAGGSSALFDQLGRPLANANETGSAAIRRLFSTQLQRGEVASLATTLDERNIGSGVGSLLPAAGLPVTFFHNPQFRIGGWACSCSYSSYQSLRAQLVRRLHAGLQTQIAYTFSKSLDDISDDTEGAGTAISLAQDTNKLSLDKGRSDFDVTHALKAFFVYELPFGPNRHFLSDTRGILGHIVGGWQFNGGVDIASGDVFSVSSGRQTLANGVSARATYSGDPELGSVRRDAQSRVIYFTPEDKALFGYPAPGSRVMSGRDMFSGPGYFNLDFSAYKNFRIAEGKTLQLRGELFNATNHANFALPNRNIDVADFGRITDTRAAARIIQVAVRVDF